MVETPNACGLATACTSMAPRWRHLLFVFIVQIIRIRAQTENIAVNDESLNVLAAIGVKSTLR